MNILSRRLICITIILFYNAARADGPVNNKATIMMESRVKKLISINNNYKECMASYNEYVGNIKKQIQMVNDGGLAIKYISASFGCSFVYEYTYIVGYKLIDRKKKYYIYDGYAGKFHELSPANYSKFEHLFDNSTPSPIKINSKNYNGASDSGVAFLIDVNKCKIYTSLDDNASLDSYLVSKYYKIINDQITEKK